MPSSHTHAPAPSRRSSARLLSLLLPALIIGVGLASGAEQRRATPAPLVYANEIRPVLQQVPRRLSRGAEPLGRREPGPIRHRSRHPARPDDLAESPPAAARAEHAPARRAASLAQQRERLVGWLTDTLNNVDPSLLPRNPGRVLIHRLTRAEYNNTVRDLLGVDARARRRLPRRRRRRRRASTTTPTRCSSRRS